MNELIPVPPAGLSLPAVTSSPGATITEVEFVMPKHVAAVVPFADHEAFGKLTPDQKGRVSFLIQLFIEMKTSPEGVVACSDRLAALHPGNGFSGSNLRTLYYAFRRRGWRALAKIYKGPKKTSAEFEEEVKRRTDNNARSARAVFAELKDAWARGESIPGYGTWREYHAYLYPERDMPERYPFGFFPEGWCESTLYTKRSNIAQRKMKTHGYSLAKRYLPHVVRDTSQLRPLELITIDDFELDFLVRAFNPVRARWEICHAAGLLAIDVATRRKLAVALVPRFKLSRAERNKYDERTAAHAELTGGETETAEEKKHRISITRADVQSLLHVVFSTHGKPCDYGCTILCENASAAITDDFELALELLLGVQVARTGLIDAKTLTNGFLQGGGKPWQKGWIESLFNLAWNTAGALPGQKGSSYQLRPADLAAKILYAEKLFTLDGLTPEIAAQLRVPFFTIDQALEGLERIFERIERRTDHKCQGFLQVFDYQVPEVAGLLAESDLALLSQEQILACTPVPRAESTVERWNRLRPACRFERIADYVLACLLLTPRKFVLRNLRLTTAKDGGLTFADADSPVMKLQDGTELLGYYDGSRANKVFVTDLKGRYIGTVRRREAVDIRNQAAISAEAGEVMRMIRSLVIEPLRERHAAEDAQLGSDRAHNEQLLRANHLLPAETAPGEPRTATMGITAGATAPAKATTDTARPATLSRKLTHPIARDAFAGPQLAQAISAEVGDHDAGKTRAEALQQADDLDSSQLI
jgi:hypothetical protein